jgi:hypothetical protein
MDADSQAGALPGWYQDPWNPDRQRYWDGQAWTGHVYAGPVAEGSVWAPSSTDVAGRSDVPPTEPVSAPPTQQADVVPAVAEPAAADGPSALQRMVPVLVVLAIIVGVAGGFAAVYAATGGFDRDDKDATSRDRTATTTPRILTPPGMNPGTAGSVPPSPSGDPAAARLSDLVVRQDDVPATVTVVPLLGGNLVSGAPTLDVCNGTFPSENKRNARLQDAAVSDQGELLLSTEAVLYDTPASGAQAFSELRAVTAGCPATPVESPVGQPTVITKVNPPPDGGWPQVPSVERLAYDLTTTDEQGQSQRTLAVYLLRGRALIGVYFAHPDGPQQAVNGETTVPGIVNVFANRLAQLPADVVNG